ncbi:hypothetical protein FRC10_006480 [Ceratobasidium sp. 414]|nr:hypothetical protein FRC10_006480 [Ceratobasidium sp. 414]
MRTPTASASTVGAETIAQTYAKIYVAAMYRSKNLVVRLFRYFRDLAPHRSDAWPADMESPADTSPRTYIFNHQFRSFMLIGSDCVFGLYLPIFTDSRNSPSPTVSPRRKKRAAGGNSKARKIGGYSAGTKGKLSGVLSLPVEIFTEIASHLTPPDIIALSRSNKFFRGLLLNRSAARIWGLALQNIAGLPPCPKDLCEPQYAALIFPKHCSMCGAPIVKPMDPYLNVRLCNACREDHLIILDDIPNVDLRRLVPWSVRDHNLPAVCLRSEKEKVEENYAEIVDTNGDISEGSSLAQERIMYCLERKKYASELAIFLDNMAETRMRELERKRANGVRTLLLHSIKRRLADASWERSDWTFPWQVARKWATLVEGPKSLTDRVWKNLYPKLVPHLEKNQGFQTERFRNDRQRRRERRMRASLVATKKQGVLLKVDRRAIRGEAGNNPDNNSLAPFLDSDGEIPSEFEDPMGNTVVIAGHRESLKVTIEIPFPPLVDALALQVVSELLEDDEDADTLEDQFEESREEVEEVLRAWGRTLEQDLFHILQFGVDHDHSDDGNETTSSGPEKPPLELQFNLPPAYAGFLDDLSSEARLLLRADSVFRLTDDKASPPPLFYPELFSIIQDRTAGYFGKRFDYYLQERPKLGRPWNMSDVVYYPEGVAAAKALLEQIFVCGLCSDKWVRTWNEILKVHHYAEALVHAHLAQGRSNTAQNSIVYNDLHSLNPASRAKGKNKPLVIFHTRQEAKVITSGEPGYWMLFQCNLCRELGISFLASKDVTAKHIRAVHAIKTPKAEHRTKANEMLEHFFVNTRAIKPRVSDSSNDEASVDEETWAERARDLGMAVYWSEWGAKGLDMYDE